MTDSADAFPHSLQAKYGIRIVPLHLAIGDEIYIAGVNISPPRVVAALMAGSKVRAFEPPISEFARVYEECAEAGAEEIVSIHVSSKIHKLYAHALEAAAHSPIPVTVIDSGTLAMAEGFVVLAAAAVAHLGGTAGEAADAARRTAASSRLYFTVETMDYLHRDGQVPALIKNLSNTLHVRPILTLKDGEISLVARQRETGPARAQVRKMIQDYVKTLTRPAVAVALAGGSAREEGLGIDGPGFSIEASPGATLTAHAGPGTYVAAAADMPTEFMLEL